MKVILDTEENLQSIITAFDSFAMNALAAMGREFTAEGYLKSIGGNSVTKTYDIVSEDSEHGFYITHPESFRGRWRDEYIDGLISLIPDSAIIDFEFTRTITEMI